MKCYIYKGVSRENSYLYIDAKDDFSRVPETLKGLLGKIVYIMELDLGEVNKLAQADPAVVIQHLQAEGYYLQMPPKGGLSH
jgi:uncharacterized protein YcgL (UPF0745 family)